MTLSFRCATENIDHFVKYAGVKKEPIMNTSNSESQSIMKKTTSSDIQESTKKWIKISLRKPIDNGLYFVDVTDGKDHWVTYAKWDGKKWSCIEWKVTHWLEGYSPENHPIP